MSHVRVWWMDSTNLTVSVVEVQRETWWSLSSAFIERRATVMVGGAKCWRKLPRIQVVRDV